jgi:hypothetical protein
MLVFEIFAALVSAVGLWLAARRSLLSWSGSLVDIALNTFPFF